MDASTGRESLLLPEGAVLVHIGPYKTGSTAIQTTLALHRDDLAAAGAVYPGEGHRQMRPTWALIERGAAGVGKVPMREWDELVEEVRAASDQRVVISSEDLASAKPDQARKLVEDLGPDRVHVLVVVRRIDKLMPSAWQERVKSWNETRTYAEWAAEVLDPKREGSAAQTFWRNHGVQNLVATWSHVVPPERIILLVADERDRSRTARTFEQLLGLPDQVLTPGPRENTSLTLDKIELYRRVNELFRDHDWPAKQRRELVYRGMLLGLRRAGETPVDVPIPKLPPSMTARVRELSRTRAEQVRSHGCVVLGDPELLTEVDEGPEEGFADLPDVVSMDTAVLALEAVVEASLRQTRGKRGRKRGKGKGKRKAKAAEAPLETSSGPDLVRALGRRGRDKARRALGR